MFGNTVDEDLEFVIGIHDVIIDESGGSKGLHDEGTLRSALGRPKRTAFGQELYADYLSRAAAMLDSIARNHPFRDGNKRTAMAVAVIYLDLNGIRVDFTNLEYEEFMLYVVNKKPDIKEITEWLKAHKA